MSVDTENTNPHKSAKADAKAAQAYAKATRPWFKKKRWWAAGVVLIAIIGSAMGGGGDTDTDATATDNSSSQSSNNDKKAVASSEEKSQPTEKAEAPAEPKAMSVTAEQMLKEFEGNEAAADLKYKGKDLEITGHVAKVDTDFFDDAKYIVQLDDDSMFAIWTVNCNDVTAEVAAKVQADSTVTVRGTFDDGGDLGVEIKNCTVI